MKVYKKLILFFVGFCIYITIECLYKSNGSSNALMGVCGGIALFLLDMINDKFGWDVDVLIQCAAGSALITGMEFIIGQFMIRGILPIMWDYSSVPFNYKGIICVPFSIIWMALSFVAIVIADAINYYVYEDTDIPYYKIFGHTFLVFPKKNCKEV